LPIPRPKLTSPPATTTTRPGRGFCGAADGGGATKVGAATERRGVAGALGAVREGLVAREAAGGGTSAGAGSGARRGAGSGAAFELPGARSVRCPHARQHDKAMP
jgi:hypothetical protein